jgi:phage-related protein
MALGFNDGVTQHIPDRGMSFSSTPKIKESPFGDGYTQRLPDGINTIKKNFSIIYKDRLKADIDDMVTFLDSTGGATAFNFTYANDNAGGQESTIKVIAKTWNKNFSYDNYFTLSITLEEVFEP